MKLLHAFSSTALLLCILLMIHASQALLAGAAQPRKRPNIPPGTAARCRHTEYKCMHKSEQRGPHASPLEASTRAVPARQRSVPPCMQRHVALTAVQVTHSHPCKLMQQSHHNFSSAMVSCTHTIVTAATVGACIDGRELWKDLFLVMKNQARCSLDQVPVTGIPVEIEHMMSSMFIDEISIRVRPGALSGPPNSSHLPQQTVHVGGLTDRRMCRERCMAPNLRQ